MGKNQEQVAMETPMTTSVQAREPAWTDNGRKINTLTSPFRKVLTGFSIGQFLIVAVTAATLGAFVNSNVRFLQPLFRLSTNRS